MVDGPPLPPCLVMRLVLDSGEPLTGTVALEGDQAGETPFCGWIELMSAIATARTARATRP